MKKNWSFIITSSYNNYLRNIVNDMWSDDLYFYSEGSDEDANLTYYFSSIHLNHLTNPKDVFEYGFQLKSIFDGLSYLIYEDKNEYRPLKLGDLICINTKEIYSFPYSVPQYPFDIDFSINSSIYNILSDTLTKFISLATYDSFIINVLLILSEGVSFRNSYQALDECKHFLSSKGKNIESLGFNKSELKRFTHTANSFAAIGREARHGSDNNSPPTNPMSLVDAQLLISKIIFQIIKNEYLIELPHIKSYKIIDDNEDWINADF